MHDLISGFAALLRIEQLGRAKKRPEGAGRIAYDKGMEIALLPHHDGE